MTDNSEENVKSIPMILFCPICHERHIDRGRFSYIAHHTHACQSCGHVWRPAIVATVGVHFLPGFKDADPDLTKENLVKVVRNNG